MSGSEDASTPSKKRGPYLRYLADPAAKIPKVSNWRKQGPCNVLSTTASQHVGVSEVARAAPPTESVSDVNSVNEPVEYPGPFGHTTVLSDITDEDSWESCVDEPDQVTYNENEVQIEDCLFEPALSSSSLSAVDGGDGEKFADDEEFEYGESDDEVDTTGTSCLILLVKRSLFVDVLLKK